MAAADYRLMTEATGQRIAAGVEALSGTGAAAAAARTNLDVYSKTETDNKISQSTATASTTATLASGWSVANEQNIIYKSGNIVSLSLWVNGETITQNEWNQIATIQSDYRPLKTIDFLGVNNGNDKAVHCQITSNGRVSVYGPADAGTNLRLFVTYFCG